MELQKVTDSAETIEDTDGHGPATHAAVQPMSEEEFATVEKRVKRKLDIRLTSMIVFIYILNYLDRVQLTAVNDPYDLC